MRRLMRLSGSEAESRVYPRTVYGTSVQHGTPKLCTRSPLRVDPAVAEVWDPAPWSLWRLGSATAGLGALGALLSLLYLCILLAVARARCGYCGFLPSSSSSQRVSQTRVTAHGSRSRLTHCAILLLDHTPHPYPHTRTILSESAMCLSLSPGCMYCTDTSLLLVCAMDRRNWHR